LNLSGVSFRELLAKYELTPDDLLVMWDEVIAWGIIRLRPEGSAGSHNGAKSVIGSIETQKFARLRLGADPIIRWTAGKNMSCGDEEKRSWK